MRSPVGRRDVVVSGVFSALLVLSILSLPSLLLTGPAYKSWPFLAAARDDSTTGSGGGAGYYPVSFAYLISASTGDAARAARLLAALYHPANCYLLHLDREAPAEEHRRLAELVSGQPVYARAGNVWIVGRPNLVTYRGPTMLSTTLHAVAMLLRLGRRWDWFVNLSASDYPLVTQDDLMDVFSRLPRDLNFIQHTSHLGWKIKKRARPVILDTALYEADRSELIRPANLTTNRRNLPTAFKLFTGSAWTMMSRQFAEYFTVGYDDNLPRTLLLYYTNFVSSPEFYFQDAGLQLPAVQEHHGEPRPALHPVGQPAQAAPALPRPQGLPPDAAQRRALRQEVQGGRPRPGQDRPGHPPPRRRRPGPGFRLRRVVLRGGRQAVLQPAGGREEGHDKGRCRVQEAQGHAQQDDECEKFQEAAV
ncbi:hypothetical protein OsJ_31640 [Oryza sativa Japonica Group]|uniref:Uncharacterized protein n=1 Tax=Oryza sativa subsp. japonica TaxID=39947 RepID=B9G5W4_ORYSJ|nr:hypothetical protein OsJ_31640 [Oryza sativa Japonica Group]